MIQSERDCLEPFHSRKSSAHNCAVFCCGSNLDDCRTTISQHQLRDPVAWSMKTEMVPFQRAVDQPPVVKCFRQSWMGGAFPPGDPPKTNRFLTLFNFPTLKHLHICSRKIDKLEVPSGGDSTYRIASMGAWMGEIQESHLAIGIYSWAPTSLTNL